ncbi:MAG TPA: Pr6Pr family membrane protein, partial [Ferruginibacter sp.]|nr:Pr6Pr family membrane protein [Ferruginibacter sp.]
MSVKKTFSLLIGVTALFAVVAQFYLMFDITTVSTAETTIRFFSYFTIMTNSLVATCFLWMFSRLNRMDSERTLHIPSYYTAITVYILVVGLIYQFILRPLWKPEGFNKIVDELLHTIVPLFTIIFWMIYGRTKTIPYSSIPTWLL